MTRTFSGGFAAALTPKEDLGGLTPLTDVLVGLTQLSLPTDIFRYTGRLFSRT